MRAYATLPLLLAIKGVSRLLFRFEVGWVGDPPPDPWDGIRILAILNHTSLFEPILAGAAPVGLLRQVARHGVAPIARKTARRPIVGRFFRLVARQVVPITRERDETWEEVLARIDDPEAMVVILPEGRMRRRTGLDAHGEPLTIRGGIADILDSVRDGRMLLVYSGGLHHVHAPGDALPRPFRTVRLKLESVPIAAYRAARAAEAAETAKAAVPAAAAQASGGMRNGFKAAVIADLTRRRDRHCPTRPHTSAIPPQDAARLSNTPADRRRRRPAPS